MLYNSIFTKHTIEKYYKETIAREFKVVFSWGFYDLLTLGK